MWVNWEELQTCTVSPKIHEGFLWWMSDTVSELSLVRESGESLGSIELECQNWRRSLNLQIHHILGPHHGNSLLAASSSTASFKWVKNNMGTNDGNCDPYILTISFLLGIIFHSVLLFGLTLYWSKFYICSTCHWMFFGFNLNIFENGSTCFLFYLFFFRPWDKTWMSTFFTPTGWKTAGNHWRSAWPPPWEGWASRLGWPCWDWRGCWKRREECCWEGAENSLSGFRLRQETETS